MKETLRWMLLLAALPSRAAADGVVLAPGPGQAGSEAARAEDETARIENSTWKLCEVTASLLALSPGRSTVAEETKAFVYLGEDLDLRADVTVPLPQGTALVSARTRLRAAAATQRGVTYFIASSGVMRSTIGFQHPVTGQDQFRQEMLSVDDGSTRLHEVFALPDLGLRVVLALQVRPVSGREEPSVLESIRDPVVGTTRRFQVEAFLKDADRLDPLEQATLVTMDGRTARLALTRLGSEGAGGLPASMPGVPSVRMIHVPGAPSSTAEEMGALRSVPADRRFQERVEALQRSIRMDPTVDLGKKLPGQRDLPGTPRKISPSKKAKIQEAQRAAAVRKWAIEQSRKLPASGDVPAGWDSESLVLEISPLRTTQASMQVELRLNGRLKLPREEAYTAIDIVLTEQLRFGETLEVGIAELVRDGEPLYDYILRITPEP